MQEILTVLRGRVHLVESLVTLGEGSSQRTLRLIEWKGPRGILRLLTNVLDLEKLRADQAVELYRARWSVERCFLTLKDTLNPNHLFNAAPAAVGQQVYATALLYNALRLAQGEIARKAGVEPERISIFRLHLDGITLVPRKGPRRKRRYCQGRKYAASYAKIPGAKKYVRI